MLKLKEELLGIQVELNAPKSQKNSFGNYMYRSCEDILTAVKPLLAKAKLSLLLTDEIFFIGARYYVKVTAALSNETESLVVTAYAREEEVKKGMDSSQITGAASSYARKYALNGLFLIDDAKDSDHTNKGEETEKKEEVKPPVQQEIPQCICAEELPTWAAGTTAPQVTGKIVAITERKVGKNKDKDITDYSVGGVLIMVWGKKNPELEVGKDAYFVKVKVALYQDKKQYLADSVNPEIPF